MEKIKNFIKSTKLLNFAFCFFMALGVFSLIFFLSTKENKVDIPLLGKVYGDIRVNIEAKDFSKIKLYANEKELPAYIMRADNSYMNFILDNTPVFNLSIKLENNTPLDDIKTIILFVSDKMFYFDGSEIKKFEKKNEKYYFPNVKYLKSSNFMTDKGALEHFALCFLSLFYNMKLYLFSFISFAIAAFLYLTNKDKINIEFTFFKKHIIWIILILAFIFRIQGNSFPFWGDELYTATVAGNPDLPFISVLSDPGNPPLFFILARFHQMIFNQNEALLRLLPCIFSTLFVYAIFIFIKDNTKKQIATTVAVLSMVNVYSIYSAQEFRCYSLCTLFSALSAFLLFRILKENKKKDYVLYTILACLMANTHYFQLLILASNYIYALLFFKTKKQKLVFTVSNLIAFISFLPYFFMTSLNNAVLDKDFNLLSTPNIKDIITMFVQNYTNGIITLISVIIAFILITPLKNKIFEKEDVIKIFLYSIYTTLFVFVQAFLISQIRPVIRTYYFINVLPFIISTIAIMLFLPFKNKKVKIAFNIFLVLIFFFFSNEYERRDNTQLITFENVFKYAYYDKNENNKTGLILNDYSEYSRFYKKYIKENETFLRYRFCYDGSLIADLINKGDIDVAYLRLDLKMYVNYKQEFEKFRKMTVIRGYKDMLIAKIEK